MRQRPIQQDLLSSQEMPMMKGEAFIWQNILTKSQNQETDFLLSSKPIMLFHQVQFTNCSSHYI